VVRIHGYDEVVGRDAQVSQVITAATETRIAPERLADLLAARGYQEAVTYSFVDPTLQQVLFPQAAALAIRNPISAELAVMRLSLWPGLVQALRENQRRQQPRVRLFELGRSFSAEQGLETELLAGLAAGSRLPEQWGEAVRAADFYDAKGDLEAIAGSAGLEFVAGTHPACHPGRCARVLSGGRDIGIVGELHPRLQQKYDLPGPPVFFEIETAVLLSGRAPRFSGISRMPTVRRDLAVLVDETVPAGRILATLRAAAPACVREIEVFDQYRGKGIEDGRKSLAFRVVMQDTDRTLTDAEVEEIVGSIRRLLTEQYKAQPRT